MAGGEDLLFRLMVGIALGSCALTGLLTWLVARRDGRRRALVVPVLAIVSVGVVLWRAQGLGMDRAIGLAAFAGVLIGPAVAGGLLGLVLSGRRKG